MSKIESMLEPYGLRVYENDAPDRQLVDISVGDKEGSIATVWGDSYSDLDFECDHPNICIEFSNSDEQCQCMLCGAYGDWHYEEDDKGNQVPEPHEWYPRRDLGGLMGQYLKELQAQNA